MIWPNTTYQILLPRYSALSQPSPTVSSMPFPTFCILESSFPWARISISHPIPIARWVLSWVLIPVDWPGLQEHCLVWALWAGEPWLVMPATDTQVAVDGQHIYRVGLDESFLDCSQMLGLTFSMKLQITPHPPLPPPIEFSLVWVPVTCMAIFILWCRTSSCVNCLS